MPNPSVHRSSRRWVWRAVGAVAVVLAASAAIAAEEPRHGGTAIIVIGADPAILNPNVTVGAPDLLTGCLLYDGLVRFAAGFHIVPSLAKSWEITPDGLTYTFHLNAASWSDGKAVTSQDVKFTLLEVSSKYGSKFVAPGKAIRDIDTPDPMTVVIRLAKPFGPFLFSLACEQNAAILPAHVFGGSDILTNPASLSLPVGQGPFQLAEWVRGDHLTLVRNPSYWTKDLPYLDRIIIKIIPEPSARLLALQAGEVDYIDQYYFPLSAYAILTTDKRFSLQEVSYPSLDLIILNTRKPPLDQVKVRQALLTAIDRNYLLKNVFLGTGQVARSAIDTRLAWAYNPAVDYEKLYSYDPKRAATLLDDAGFKSGPGGTRLTLRLSFDTGRPEYTSLAQALQSYWQAVGVKTVLEGTERPVVLKRVYTDYDFDATLQNYSTSGDPALGISRTYTTEAIKQGQSFNNASGYSNPAVDEGFDRGRDGASVEDRKLQYFKVQELLAHDLPVLTIHQQAQIGVSSVQLRNQWKAAVYQWWDQIWLTQ
jgi:peptide/nickel transport system substrate-binding protein